MSLRERLDTRYYPAWGPYSKEHMGFSRRLSDETGERLDCIVVPGIYRGRVFVPSAVWDAGCLVDAAAVDLGAVRMLHEMTETLSAEVDWRTETTDIVTATVRFRNASSLPVSTCCHILFRLAPPRLKPGSDEVRLSVAVPAGLADRWSAAADYVDLFFARPGIRDSLVYDGYRRGIEPVQGSVRGVAVASGWGADTGDTMIATLHCAEPGFRSLGIRYSNASDTSIRIRLKLFPSDESPGGADAHTVEVALPPSDGFQVSVLPLSGPPESSCRLELETVSGAAGLCLDGFFCFEDVREGILPDPCSVGLPADRPAVSQGIRSRDALELTYAGGERFRLFRDHRYDTVLRTVETRNLDEVMAHLTHNHVQLHIRDKRYAPVPGLYEPYYLDLFLRPLAVEAGGELSFVFRIEGPDAASCLETADFPRGGTAPPYFTFDGDPPEPGIRHGADRLAAVALSNVVYPVQIRGQYTCHTTPGRWWDSVYTWDAGFSGIGLSVFSPERARESLDTYLGADKDLHRAFLHHGSPVPVQAYLAKELMDQFPGHENRTRDYRRLLRYYEFLAGRGGSSATNPFRSKLRTTFAYFYNSGGWDDYPAQNMVHARGIADRVAPVVTNAHLVRFARLLSGFARLLDDEQLPETVSADLEEIMHALRAHAWDEDAKIFGYVEHDETGQVIGVLRAPGGENANLGLDGLSPLVTGALLSYERDALIARLFSPDHMWTGIGISTVDVSASYARSDGYWNGAVWMPHQWFMWKTCLDLGLGSEAWKIARTALELWAREVQESRRCYEHFPLSTGRGAGWHQFGGLSSPVLNWYAAYYQPGTVTVGLDTWILRRSASQGVLSLSLQVDESSESGVSTILICPDRGAATESNVILNGSQIGFAVFGNAVGVDLAPGAYELSVSCVSRENGQASPR